MSKRAVSCLRAAAALTAVLPLARESRGSDCRAFIEETVINETPYAAISNVEVAQDKDTLAIRLKYQVHSPEEAEQAREQLFIAVEQFIVATVYDGSPGPCPGVAGDWSNRSISVIPLPPASHTVYAVHTAADSQAAGLDGYEHDGIGWRVEIGVFAVPENAPSGDHAPPPQPRQTCPPAAGGDTDDDGVCGNQDACPDSDVRPTLVIQECDCLVPNQVIGAGCTMADEIAAIAVEAHSTKDFVHSVSRVATSWERAGLISEADRKRIESCSEEACFPAKEPGKLEPPLPAPDEQPPPPDPPSWTDATQKTPGYEGDAQEREQTGDDPGSGSAGQPERITGFESASVEEPAPPVGCGFGLMPLTLFWLAFTAVHPDRLSRSRVRRASCRIAAPFR